MNKLYLLCGRFGVLTTSQEYWVDLQLNCSHLLPLVISDMVSGNCSQTLTNPLFEICTNTTYVESHKC